MKSSSDIRVSRGDMSSTGWDWSWGSRTPLRRIVSTPPGMRQFVADMKICVSFDVDFIFGFGFTNDILLGGMGINVKCD